MAAGSCSALSMIAMPKLEPSLAGLTTQRSPTVATMSSMR